jgi:hypothetical protein
MWTAPGAVGAGEIKEGKDKDSPRRHEEHEQSKSIVGGKRMPDCTAT